MVLGTSDADDQRPGASQVQVLHAAIGVLRLQAEPTPLDHDALVDAAAAQADADRLAAERANRAEHSVALAELNNKLKAQNQLARDACGAKHAALAAKNKRALCVQLAAGLLYAGIDAARMAAVIVHRTDKPAKFTLNPADELLPAQFKETAQLLIKLEFLTETGGVTATLSDAKRMALCLTGIPSELMTRLLETGINVSLAAFRRFVKEALEQTRSKGDIAAAIALALETDSATPLTFEHVTEAAPSEPRETRTRPSARPSAQNALALETDSVAPPTFERVAEAAPSEPRESRTRAAVQLGEASALASSQPAVRPSGRTSSGSGRRSRASERDSEGGGCARKMPKCEVMERSSSAHLLFTLEDAQRVQAAAQRLQAFADRMRLRLDAVASASASGDADALDNPELIEHVRALSHGVIGLAEAPILATATVAYELITKVELPRCRASQFGLNELEARARRAAAEADGRPSVSDAA